ncbi:MAG: TIGR02147 family protein [Chitinispirillaceae bacterium]|nr:TIGR02147 family protein [Chitinispirillaceae bacterium]
MSEQKLPDIFTYDDFRKYLEDYRSMRKKWDEGFTHEYICFRLGQRGSRGYFSNVVNGTRNVSQEFVNRFVELLELGDTEGSYFRDLVQYNQTSNVKEKEFLLKRINRQSTIESKMISTKEYAFYEEWYHSVLRTVLDVVDFKDDYHLLTKTVVPSITLKQAKDSIDLLIELGLIQQDRDGFWRPAQKSIKTPEYVQARLVRQYQLQCLDLAKMVCASTQKQTDDIYTNVISISENGLRELQQRLRLFREEVRAIVHNDTAPADRVYQLDIQLFPNSIVSSSERSTK